jgi:hypothetical protein
MAAGLATTPYLAINLGQIYFHNGSFIHFNKMEALVLTAILALGLWLETAAVLVASAALSRNKSWLHGCIAVAAFAVIATAVEPGSWSHFLDLLNDGLGEWIFRVGVLATLLTLALKRTAPKAPYHG